MVFKRKSRSYKKTRKSMRKPKVSKNLTRAIKQVFNRNVETKIINVPDSASLGLTNTKNRVYASLGGLQYLAFDIFKCTQGTADSTALLSANRVGDKVQAVGFEMNYMFHTRNTYSIGSSSFVIPFVKLRIVVFRTIALATPLSQGQLCDISYLPSDTSVLQPLDWDEGYTKEILYDRVHIIRNQLSHTDSVSNPNSQSPYNNVYHFKKYIKYNHPIKYLDSNSGSPNSTDKPLSMAILAEVDDSFSGLVPSGVTLLYTTGYTRAWFKDA